MASVLAVLAQFERPSSGSERGMRSRSSVRSAIPRLSNGAEHTPALCSVGRLGGATLGVTGGAWQGDVKHPGSNEALAFVPPFPVDAAARYGTWRKAVRRRGRGSGWAAGVSNPGVSGVVLVHGIATQMAVTVSSVIPGSWERLMLDFERLRLLASTTQP